MDLRYSRRNGREAELEDMTWALRLRCQCMVAGLNDKSSSILSLLCAKDSLPKGRREACKFRSAPGAEAWMDMGLDAQLRADGLLD